MNILLSIITVSFNSRKTIRETIESVISIKDSSIEYIVIDGDSRDGTQEIVREYWAHVDHFVSEKDQGIFDAMNKGLFLAQGQYCLFLNSDDYLQTSDFPRILERLRKGTCEWLFGNVNVVTEQGEPYGVITPNPQLLNSRHLLFMPIAHPGAIMRTASLQALRGFDFAFGNSADYELLLRYLEKYGKGEKVELTLSNYRLGGVSAHPSYRKLREHWKIWSAHNYPLPVKAGRYIRDLASTVLSDCCPGLIRMLKKFRKGGYIVQQKEAH